MIKNLKHLVVISELLVACGVLVVRLLNWKLLEHGARQHVDVGATLNQFFEFLEFRDEFLRMFLDMGDLLSNPFPVCTGVCWEPCSSSAWSLA
jgi:hypothetical protein